MEVCSRVGLGWAGLGWPVGERESQRKEEQNNPSRGSGHWRSGEGWEAGQQPPGPREAMGREKKHFRLQSVAPLLKKLLQESVSSSLTESPKQDP